MVPAPRAQTRPVPEPDPDHAPRPQDHVCTPPTMLPLPGPWFRPWAVLSPGPDSLSGHPSFGPDPSPQPDPAQLPAQLPAHSARPGPTRPSPAQPSPAQPSQNTADSRSQRYLRPGQYPGRNRLPRVGCRVRIRRRSSVSPRHRVRAGVIAERALTSFRPATMLGPPRFRAYRQTNPAASDSARMRPRDPGLIS
jgi:hypothetical protein